jgi:23S rRNA (cytosine1962-C5)-methyltransferase
MTSAPVPLRARLRLRVTAAAESTLRAGHPWLFADSIRDQNRPGELGELAVIYDRQDRFLALGFYDPDSPIRVRVLHAGKPRQLDRTWWSERLNRALKKRRGLFDQQTTGFRWINGESDGWPGLVLDRYDQMLVLKFYTGAWLPRLEEIASLIGERLQPERLVLRLSRNLQPESERLVPQNGMNETRGRKVAAPAEILFGSPPAGPVLFLESGLRFEADVVRGQKTGFFLDQRENRRQVERLTRGRAVLNVFSFSGGFSLYAARGGARSVTDLDISAHALAAGERNFRLNQSFKSVAACRRESVQADAFDWLSERRWRRFDLIVLDPPSLAKRESERAGAICAYTRLAALAISHLSTGGILVASSCSAHVSAEEFFGAVRAAARQSRRKFTEFKTTGHAPDHPAGFKEAEYLKTIYLREQKVD